MTTTRNKKPHMRDLYSEDNSSPKYRKFQERSDVCEKVLIQYVTHDTMKIAKAYLKGVYAKANSDEYKASRTAHIAMHDALMEAGCTHEDVYQLLENGEWMYFVSATIAYDSHNSICECDRCKLKRSTVDNDSGDVICECGTHWNVENYMSCPNC